MRCPNCSSTQTKSFPSVYAQGTRTGYSGRRKFTSQSDLARRCQPPLSPLHPISLFGILLGGWPFDYFSEKRAWQHSWVCLSCDHSFSDLAVVKHAEEKASVSSWETDGNLPHWANKRYDGHTRKVVALPPPPPPVRAAKAPPIRPTSIHAVNSRTSEAAIEWPQASPNGHPDISIGMTMDAVRASSWGRPRNIDKSSMDGTGTEAWTYPEGRLVFEAGRIAKILLKKDV